MTAYILSYLTVEGAEIVRVDFNEIEARQHFDECMKERAPVSNRFRSHDGYILQAWSGTLCSTIVEE